MEDPGSAYSGIDNLSRLPDDILSRILSLLCTEDAVRTSVLSKRWRYLYTSISNLDLEFNFEVLKITDEQDCMNFLDIFFFYRKKCAFDKFKLKWKFPQAIDPLRLGNWIGAVLGHGIRELDLCFYVFNPKDLLLPSSLFTCKSLEVLKLYIWKSGYSRTNNGLELPARVCLPSLKSIHLRNVSFSEDSWGRLFDNCPILEDFLFNFNCGYFKLRVSSPILKRLTIEQYDGFFDVFVDAPSLVYLGVSICEAQSLKLVNARFLIEADIQVFRHGGGISSLICSELVRGISSIQTLCMSTTTIIEVLEHNRVPIPVLHNMTHLSICGCYLGLDALPNLLEKCESLETLVFKDLCEWNPDIWNRADESGITCLTSVVKTIEVGAFIGRKSEIEMVKYFLKSARVLELIEINFDYECENPSKIANWLPKLPKNSKAIMDVIF